MGREVRRVPPDWVHPTESRYDYRGERIIDYIPLFDDSVQTAQEKWDKGKAEWPENPTSKKVWGDDEYARSRGYSPDTPLYADYEDYAGRRPTLQYSAEDLEEGEEHLIGQYRPYRVRHWEPEEATAYQIYETVSEGTPVSPVFETEDAMYEWLIEKGYSEEAAKMFCKHGYAPSFVMFNDGQGNIAMAEDIESLTFHGNSNN